MSGSESRVPRNDICPWNQRNSVNAPIENQRDWPLQTPCDGVPFLASPAFWVFVPFVRPELEWHNSSMSHHSAMWA